MLSKVPISDLDHVPSRHIARIVIEPRLDGQVHFPGLSSRRMGVGVSLRQED